ncbi:MAG: hypothetical protein IOC39_28425 [Burkholderia sp.]|jgi:microcystin degradation protein MlrC|uniref:hypothetical protein n=1 Tax=Burkholderia TaxID=32008 RepID=UPI001CA3D754|nr:MULTISPECIES: hypothetical protein [Burkholderia]MBY8605597.1 hypothetical protein [Burkholderia arboris]MCA3780897.1 hypothetical protein [Burkholderia sp.]MCA3789394.1 hypothetical protein [Burkholderia sp.]MCA3794414.1 hypothetical protein [Burkholderia sp.]MCA3799225.1 hypothetical protein [Burkholderia sp.]
MKIPIARVTREANAFSPVPTPRVAFSRNGPERSVIGIHGSIEVAGIQAAAKQSASRQRRMYR